ncbi:spore cortex-lytic enzyme [Caproiciproducens sp. LBM24188]|nr:spore cortex-lytic enzyme [Oscillospiraceae bacterium]HHV32211.1 spore cortex-lytic enzyme [Clostridiales bacterium]
MLNLENMEKQKKLKYCWCILVVILLNVLVIAVVTNLGDSVSTLSKYGSQGAEVKQIQTKLKSLGFYTGTVDSIYGTQTKNAVTRFQRSRGLTADGIAGPKTLAALGIGSSGGTSGGLGGFSSKDVSLLAQVTSAEARGEPYAGQVAVAAVILNRIQHPSFPNTLAGVVYQPGAFSCMTDGGIYHEISDSAYRAARDAINGWDPSGGAIYYYNPAKSTSKWIFSRPVITVIGKHRFCK